MIKIGTFYFAENRNFSRCVDTQTLVHLSSYQACFLIGLLSAGQKSMRIEVEISDLRCFLGVLDLFLGLFLMFGKFLQTE